jgi:uncharacterized protein YlzI (FlbEa/FlbD family)
VTDAIREIVDDVRHPVAPDTTAARPSAKADFTGLVDIGGRKMYLQCTGQGSPTVVLISGNQQVVDDAILEVIQAVRQGRSAVNA